MALLLATLALGTRDESCMKVTPAQCKQFARILSSARHDSRSHSWKAANGSYFGAGVTGGLGSGLGYNTIRFPLAGAVTPCTLPGKRDPVSRLQGLNLSFHGKRVLDLGCNAGGMLLPVAWNVREGIGVDFDDSLVDAATQISGSFACSRLHFHKFDLLRWPLDGILDMQRSCDRCRWDIISMYSLTSWLVNWRAVISWALKNARVLVIEVNRKLSVLPSTGERAEEVEKLLRASCASVDDRMNAMVAFGQKSDRWTLVCHVTPSNLPWGASPSPPAL